MTLNRIMVKRCFLQYLINSCANHDSNHRKSAISLLRLDRSLLYSTVGICFGSHSFDVYSGKSKMKKTEWNYNNVLIQDWSETSKLAETVDNLQDNDMFDEDEDNSGDNSLSDVFTYVEHMDIRQPIAVLR